ncbi:MAG TPA: hypothetical protein VN628_00490 [Vicinamibacterales bacterium]|nr:hypothetical protein [Vicinamibacterales bacterium]
MSTTNTGAAATGTSNAGGTPTPAAAAATAAAAAGNQAAGDAAAGGAAAAAAAGTGDGAAAAAAASGAAAAGNEGTKKETPAGETPKAPDKYALTLPEGGRVDASDVAKLEAIARANNWTNDQAQAALTEHDSALKAQSDQFLTDLRTHAEIGGEHLAVSQQRANAVLDTFLPAESPEGKALRADLNKSGYANYAPLVLLLARIGKSMSEDTSLKAQVVKASAGKRDAATVLYGG